MQSKERSKVRWTETGPAQLASVVQPHQIGREVCPSFVCTESQPKYWEQTFIPARCPPPSTVPTKSPGLSTKFPLTLLGQELDVLSKTSAIQGQRQGAALENRCRTALVASGD